MQLLDGDVPVSISPELRAILQGTPAANRPATSAWDALLQLGAVWAPNATAETEMLWGGKNDRL